MSGRPVPHDHAGDRAHGPAGQLSTETMRQVTDGLYFGPHPPGPEPWTDEQVTRFAAEWRRQANRGHLRLLTPPPLRVRARLAARRRVDLAATWLVRHGHHHAAVRVWKTFGMWRR